jgi:hypothetical protein
MRRQLAALVVGLFVIPQLASSQPLAPGSRVRFTYAGDDARTGTLVALTADSLEVRLPGRSQASRMPLSRVMRLDVSNGSERHILATGQLGLLVGVAVGAGIGAVSNVSCDANGVGCMSRSDNMMLGGVFLGALGGVVGLIAGLRGSEKWEHVQLQRPRGGDGRSVAPSRGGVALSLAF